MIKTLTDLQKKWTGFTQMYISDKDFVDSSFKTIFSQFQTFNVCHMEIQQFTYGFRVEFLYKTPNQGRSVFIMTEYNEEKTQTEREEDFINRLNQLFAPVEPMVKRWIQEAQV